MREIKRNTVPIDNISIGLFWLSRLLLLAKLNKNIPVQAIKPTNNFYFPNWSFLSLTLEQATPTITTDSKLQDFTITTAGKEVEIIALLYP